MADGELTLRIEPELAERMRAAADLAGQPVEQWALTALAAGITQDDEGWAEDEAAFEEYDRSGVGHEIEPAFDKLRKNVLARIAKRV